jgi:Raf kinase inhibitor-like YbhB/YbcL family protein
MERARSQTEPTVVSNHLLQALVFKTDKEIRMAKSFARTMVLFIGVLALAATPSMAQGGGAGQGAGRGGGGGGGRGGAGIVTLAVSSTSFPDGGEIPAKYAGQQGISPQLSWTGAPAGTMSYVLVMHDVDAAIGGTDISHWVVWSIPASSTSIPEGGPVPAGANQYSLRGPQYMGPAPPAGHPYHHYIFQIYALNSTLDVPAGATRADVEKAMEGKIIARGSYVGRAKPPQ